MSDDQKPFCGDPLWDANLTWFTDDPDLTDCFQQSVLVYLPSAFLLLMTPTQLSVARNSRDRLTPWSLVNGMKLVINVVMILLAVVLIGVSAVNWNHSHVYPVDLVAALVKLLTFLNVLFVQMYNKRKGIVTSGILLAFWFLQVVCSAPAFISALRTAPLSHVDQQFQTVVVVQFALVLTMLFLNFWADPRPKYIDLEDQADDLTPEHYSSALSKMVFAWIDPLVWKGRKSLIGRDDLWQLRRENRSSTVVPHWTSNWEKEDMKKTKNHPSSVLPVLVRTFGPSYLLSSCLILLLSVLQFVSPQVVEQLIHFVESDDPLWKGYFYTLLIVVVTFACTILNAQAFYRQYQVGLRVKTALISAIYRKSLKLSNRARKEMTVGETTNLMQIDTQKFMDLALYLNMLWSSPLQIGLALYFLWNILGPASLAGFVVMILLGPVNAIVAKTMRQYQLEQMKNKDRRTKTMDEILNGIKILKLYAWEMPFCDKVNAIRRQEIVALKKSAYLNALLTLMWVCAPVLVALASFATFILIDENNVLDARTAFVSLTLFNLLRFPLNVLPMLLVYIVQCQVSLRRINKFMNSEELDPDAVSHDETVQPVVQVQNGSFSWDGQQPVLNDINLTLNEGALVAVVGQVGCGKSSLMSALLGEMHKISGQINTRGKVAYVPQQAWIQNGSVQYNIVFGLNVDQKKYQAVLESCSLVDDLKVLPAGDQTEIGEKGINLSGGQKQRISLARSVYSDSDLYLLDDPLSAVDPAVGSHLFNQVLGPDGMLKHTTRILVTHSVKYLPQMDHIVVMKDGCISEQGTYQQLLQAGQEFADFLVQHLVEETDGDTSELDVKELKTLKANLENVLGPERIQRQLSKTRSVSTGHGSNSAVPARMPPEPTPERSKVLQPGSNLIEDEKMEVGGVKWRIYMFYMKSIGWGTMAAAFLLYFAFAGFAVGSSIWLSVWSTDPNASINQGVRNMYLAVYGVLGLVQSVFIMMAVAVLSIGALNAAFSMHRTMLSRILRAPMFFFDTTPIGRILNRFSKDIDVVDVTLPMVLRSLVSQMLAVFCTVILICFANPLFVAVLVPIALFFYLLQRIYIATARQVKRLEAISRSPIYTLFSETISGASTIRAYNRTASFIQENERRIDTNQTYYYPSFVCSRWLSVRLETLGNLIVFFSSLFAVLTRDWMDAGLVGLALSNSLTVTNSLSFLVSLASELETNMVGVERIREFQEIQQEAPLHVPGQDPGPDWPAYGVVRFDQYQTRYRPGLDLVLKGVTCQIRAGEKIGIVGRTGAGKSSLTLALFRIIESASGSIYIDDVNVGQIGLLSLRSRITIIPQDPVLFSGSLRMNLDPFDQYSEDQLWRSLEMAHLKAFVSNLKGGLNFEVNEGGENLSVGQRQLVCLARALLRHTKVLVLDEATAAVDLETDDLVQTTIRKAFRECTVLTIAHRVNTIMDSARIMVVDQGKIAEFDTPERLLENKKSIFYGMAKESGLLPS